MGMQVIFLKDVRGVGRINEVKQVSDGYARNFLLPQNLVELATPQKIIALKSSEREKQALRVREEEELDKKVSSLQGREITLSLRATPKGGLFKTVSLADVVDALHKQLGFEITHSNINMPQAVKVVGEHIVRVQGIHKKADITLKVIAL